MYKGHCILTFTQTARVPAARHMRLDTIYGTDHRLHRSDAARNARATRRVRSRACGPSHAARQELLDDVRKSAVRPRIEQNDAGEQIMSHTRHTLSGTWHWKQRLRQRPMMSLTQQHRSTSGFHGGPAHRTSGRRCVDHLPPPRKSQCRTKRQPDGGAVAVERRQCWPLGTPPTTTNAAAWSRVQHSPRPGSCAPARPRATKAADPCSISAFG